MESIKKLESINQDAFHHMDANKANLSDHDLDSGYVTNWSISQSHATTSTSTLNESPQLRSNQSFKKSFHLATVNENDETKGLQETPTTRNIRQLNEFHIKPLMNNRNDLEKTPIKENYFGNIHAFDSNDSGNIQWSLNKSTPTKCNSSPTKRTRSNACDNLFGSINIKRASVGDSDYSFETGIQNQSINDVSPIKHNQSNNIMQTTKVATFQRHPSGIESSTPKKSMKRFRTQSIIKSKYNQTNNENLPSHLIRKAQSFSPAKRNALREMNFDMELIANERPPNQIDQFKNPAQKVLEFTAQEFGQLIQSNQIVHFKTPTKIKSVSKEHSQKKSLNAEQLEPGLNEIDFINALNDNDDHLMDFSISDESITPKKSKLYKTGDTPVRNEFIKRNIREKAIRTPTKRFSRSTSCNPTSHDVHFVKAKQYGHLHCTPPKNYQIRSQKRTAANRDASMLIEPSAKRKLYELCSRTQFYDSFEKLDILKQLKKFKVPSITQTILGYLPDESLHAVYCVSKSWRSLIDSNEEFRLRRRQFVEEMKTSKENAIRMQINTALNYEFAKKPFHIHNTTEIKTKKVPLSPSTQKYRDNQEVVKKLKPGEKLIHCPLCNASSIIITPNSLETSSKIRALRRSPRRQIKYKKRSVKIVSEYAVCTRRSCQLEFCTNCKANRHESAECPKPPLGSSPRSDDEITNYSSSRQSLRRLKF